MLRNKFHPHQTTSTGGFCAAMFTAMACVPACPNGRNKASEFLDSADAGYCLDAPPVIPAGAMFDDELTGRPATLVAVRGL